MPYETVITASTDIDHSLIQLSTLMAVQKGSETTGRTTHVAGNDYDNHTYRTWPYKWGRLNPITASQLSTMISRRTWNQDAILHLNWQYQSLKAKLTGNCKSA
jgi:hypothetical protein